MKQTTMGIPPVKLPGGQQINVARILRTLLGAGIVVSLLAGWVEPDDKIELGIWLGLAILLIDAGLLTVAVDAVRALRNGGK